MIERGLMRCRWRLVGGIAGLALAVGVAVPMDALGGAGACSSPAGAAACLGLDQAPFVTGSQAASVATALWNAQERANAGKDRALYDQIETGTAQLAAHYALDDLICGCSKWYWTQGPRVIRNLTVFLPSESNYPLYFMAEVLAAPAGKATAANRATSDIIITRAGPEEPWKIAMTVIEHGYGPTSPAVPAPQLDANGYEVMPAAPSTSAARKWPAMLAAYYAHLKDTGSPPPSSPFLPGPLTTGTNLTERGQGYTSSDGVTVHYRFAVGPPDEAGEPWILNWDGLTACADVLEYATESWAKPHTVFEQIDRQPGNWGSDLDTGYYSKIIITWEWPVCISGSGGSLSVGGTSTAYPIHTGGIPAVPSPGTTRVA